jgi:Na+/melibiose symporter-like transporter
MNLFKVILFLLAIATSLACTVLLFRGYMERRVRMLLWSALCFVFLTANNLLLFVDLVLLSETVDLRALRHGTALLGLSFLLYGFIRES